MWGSPKTHAYTHQKVHLEMAFALSTGFGALPQVFLVRFIMSFLETMTLSKTFYWKNHIHIYHGIHIHKMFISYFKTLFTSPCMEDISRKHKRYKFNLLLQSCEILY